MILRFPQRFTAATLLAALAVSFAPAAGAADAPLKVLRHMTFDVTYDSESTVETKVSGMGNGVDSANSDVGAASGTARQPGPSTTRKGLITVDVVAATGDGGLAVDVTQEHNGPPVRVGITSASGLLLGQGVVLTEEEQALLRFLARGFVKADVIAAGSTWTDKAPDPNVTDQTTYRVMSIDTGASTMVVDINGATDVKGMHAYRETTTGTLTYDTAMSVPVSFEVSTRIEVDTSGRLETVVGHINSKLHDDSMRKS